MTSKWSDLLDGSSVESSKPSLTVVPPPPDMSDIDPREELWKSPAQLRKKLAPMPTEVFGALQTWVDCTAVQKQVQPEMIGMPLIAAVGVLIGRRCQINFDQDRANQPISVYSLVVAAPGERKTSAFNKVYKPIYDLETQLIEAAKPGVEAQRAAIELMEADLAVQKKLMSTGKNQNERDDARNEFQRIQRDLALVKSVPVVLPQLTADDVTMERLASLMMEQGGTMASIGTEATILENVMGRYSSGKANLGLVLKAWDAEESYKVDRISRDPVVIEKPRLTLSLAVQPSLLESAVGSNDSVGRGLMGRFLMAVPESMVGYRKRVSVTYDQDAWARLVPWIYESAPDMLQFEHEAWLAEVTKEDEWEERLKPTGDLRAIRDWSAKISSHSIRLAGIFHVLRMATGEINHLDATINAEDVARAHTVIEWMIDHVLMAHEIMGVYQSAGFDALAEELLKAIRETEAWGSKTYFNSSQAHQKLKNRPAFAKVDQFHAICRTLVDAGWLKPGSVTGTTNRPRTYSVNEIVYDESYEPSSGV